MNLEWEIPHELTSKYGSVLFNVPDSSTGRVFRIQPETYKIVPSLRVTQDNISQADGSVLHPRWKSGLVAIIQVALNVMTNPLANDGQATPACGNDLREMSDELLLHLNAIRSQDTGDEQRLYWTPTGLGDRQLLLNIELLTIWEPSYDLSGTEALVAFAVETPFPYCIAATQTAPVVANGATVTIDNDGNCPFSPVLLVDNQTTNPITITNLDDVDEDGVPLKVVYDTTRPGGFAIPASDYVEFDFFQGTQYVNGDGADAIANIEPTETDYWHLNPGPNRINIVGADAVVLTNDAWS